MKNYGTLKRAIAYLLLFCLVLGAAGCKKQEAVSSVPEVSSEPEPEPEIDATTQYGSDGKTFLELYGENDDTIGWLTIPGIKTDNVVMMGVAGKTYPNDDGSTTNGGKFHYLHYDFNHESSSAGELFTDYRGVISPRTIGQNIVIFGHHMRDGTMLAGLDDYRSKSYSEQHQYMTFNTLWEQHHWRVFTVFMVDLTTEYGKQFDYLQPEYKGDAFTNYVNEYKARQYFDTGVEITEDDHIITLSTCTYPTGHPATDDARLVVCARMCTPEEEAELAAGEAASAQTDTSAQS